ncbi:MAG: helix-turn-helix domain-containing protein [Treponema sp.]|nr:helix-turn-helix domain-containing protein [Treponema sp.]
MKNIVFSDQIKLLMKTLGLKQASLAVKLGLSQGVISEFASGSREPSKEFLLGLSKLGVSLDWFLTGEGEILITQNDKKHPFIAELEAIVDKKLEKIEARIAEIEGRINAGPSKAPDSGMFVSEPEPEYGEEQEDIIYVEGIAAGKPIFQSEARSTIPVPKRYIKTKPEDYYVGHIKGTSMTAAGIPDGVLVLIRISDVPRDGAIQVVECQGEATLKRMREIPGKGWKICFDDHTGRYIEIGPGDEFHIQGDFIAVLPEDA